MQPLSWSSDDLRHMVDRPRFGLEEPAYRAYIAEHVLALAPGQRIADIGCGSAASSLTLVPFILPGGTLTGFDRDADGVANARHNAEVLRVSAAATFAEGDAAALPAADASFDVTMCQTVLMHVPDVAAVLAEMIRVTVPCGLVAATEPDFSTSTVRHLNGAARTPEEAALWAAAMARVYTGGRMRRAGDWAIGSQLVLPFRAAGLKTVRMRPVPASWMVFPSAQGQPTGAFRWAMELFYPDEDTRLFGMQRDNHAAAAGSAEEWEAFAALRRRERDAILGEDGGASALLHVNTSAYITTGRVPEGRADG